MRRSESAKDAYHLVRWWKRAGIREGAAFHKAAEKWPAKWNRSLIGLIKFVYRGETWTHAEQWENSCLNVKEIPLSNSTEPKEKAEPNNTTPMARQSTLF